MKASRIALLVAVFFLSAFPQFAQAVSLEEAVSMSLEAEAGRASAYEREAAGADARSRASFTYPQASLGASYVRLGTNAEESPFVQFPDENLAGRVEASQLLWAGGRITGSRDLSRDLREGADLAGRTRVRQIKRQARLAFYEVLYRRALVEVQADRAEQRREELADARDLREVGMVTSLDVRQAKLLLNNALEELGAQEAELKQALVDFNIVIGRSGGGELLEPEGALQRAEALGALIEAAGAALSEGRLLDLRLAENELSARRNERKIAAGEFWPELVLFGSAESVTEGVFQDGESWTAGVELRWTVLDGGLRRAQREASGTRLELARENLSLKEKRLSGALRSSEVRAESLERRIALREEAVSLSRQNYLDARAQYRAGTITQTRLGEFNLSYAEARFALRGLYFQELQLLTEIQALIEGL